MAHIRRLMWFALGVLLVAVPMLSYADDYPRQQIGWGNSSGGSTVYPQWQTICQIGVYPDRTYLKQGDNYQCWLAANLSPSFQTSATYRGFYAYPVYGCPYGGTLSGATCINAPACETGQRTSTGECFQCPSGTTWNGTTCVNPCQAKAGNTYGTSDSWASVSSAGGGGSTFCDGTCAVQATSTECTRTNIGGSGDFVSLGESCVMRGPFKMTGAGCGGDGTYPTLDYVEQQERPWWESGSDEKGCQAIGGAWGQYMGIDTCVAPQPGETVQNETTTTPAEGNKNTTTNPDGSTTETTTKETTSTDGGKATTTKETTTIYRNPDGSIANQETKTETSEQPLSEFCKTNPAHPSCVGTKTDGSFAGSCSGGFKCSGDAVQCAIAEAVHKQRCDAAEAETEASEFLQQVGPGTIDAAKVAEALNSDGAFDFDIFQAFEDARQNYITFAAECLPPLGFEFKGHSYTFDVQFICEIGDFVRVMLHIIAYSAVLGLISRAFGG